MGVDALGDLIDATLALPLECDGGLAGFVLNGSGSDVGVGPVMGSPIEECDAMGLIVGEIGCEALICGWLNRSLPEAATPPPTAS